MISNHFYLPYLDVDTAKNDTTSNSDEVEALKKALASEKTLKTQAVNKLAEIIQRKDVNKGKSKGKVSASEVTKKEKENRKLQLELRQVYLLIFFKPKRKGFFIVVFSNKF